jgi:GNAT superfamily N-acetyltransferase
VTKPRDSGPTPGPEPFTAARIRPADGGDLPEILHSLNSAAQWTRSLGEKGWPVPFPEEFVRPSLERGELYVAEWEGELAGSFILRWADEAFWGPQPPLAGYLHQLAVRRDRPVRGLGRRLVAAAIDLVRVERRLFLRLDCLASNHRLIAYYGSLGFQSVRVVTYPHDVELDVLLMERSVESHPVA